MIRLYGSNLLTKASQFTLYHEENNMEVTIPKTEITKDTKELIKKSKIISENDSVIVLDVPQKLAEDTKKIISDTILENING